MSLVTIVVADRRGNDRRACVRRLHRERGIRVVGEAQNSAEVRVAANLKPRVLVLDVELGSNGLTLLRIVRRTDPETKVLLLVDCLPEAGLLKALFAGARGYLERAAVRRFLPRAVRVVDAGEAWVPRRLVSRITDQLVRLSARE